MNKFKLKVTLLVCFSIVFLTNIKNNNKPRIVQCTLEEKKGIICSKVTKKDRFIEHSVRIGLSAKSQASPN